MSVRIPAPVAPACLDMAIRLLITDIRAILVTGIAHTRSGVDGGETEQHAIFRHACTAGLEGMMAKLETGGGALTGPLGSLARLFCSYAAVLLINGREASARYNARARKLGSQRIDFWTGAAGRLSQRGRQT